MNLTERELHILEKASITCRDVTILLGGYVDGELIPTLRERVEGHISLCQCCQEGERRYRDVIEMARALPEPAMPEGANRRLREALNRRLGLNLRIN